MTQCWRAMFLMALLGLGACDSPVAPITGTRVRFSVAEGAGFFAAPWPRVGRVREDGTLVVADFPNPNANALLARLLDGMERSPTGFSATAAVFLPFDGPLDPATFPADAAASLGADSGVFLVDVDPDSPTLHERVPVWVQFKAAAETYSPANLLVVLPRPGLVLRPGTQYAAVVLDNVRDAAGQPLGSPLALEQLKRRQDPGGPDGEALRQAFSLLRTHLAAAGIDWRRLRAATVFRTGQPHVELDQLRTWIHAQPAPVASGLVQRDDFDTFCVVRGEVDVPLFQDGERPYNSGGGEIRLDAAGEPATVAWESIRFAVSIPKRPMPAQGWPLLFYSAGQGGEYLQFVHRGTFAEQAQRNGRGPAYYLADVGVAAVSIEAPLVGPRHPDNSYEGLDFFNVMNPAAFRDNVRQGALDFVTLARLARRLSVDAGLCPGADAGPGASAFVFDAEQFYFHGHSTGFSVGSLVLGLEPDIRAGLLSGAGGSWLYNLTIKAAPIDFANLVVLLLGYQGADWPDLYDPVLSLFQTYADPAEPMVWARRWAAEPGPGASARDILIVEGVVDGYFPPEAVNALALSARAEPVGPVVEPTLTEALAIVGGEQRTAPATGNLQTPDGPRSSLLVQHAQPEGVDGHYVPFELPGPKYQYRCFFASIAAGGPATVPAADASPLAVCPQ